MNDTIHYYPGRRALGGWEFLSSRLSDPELEESLRSPQNALPQAHVPTAVLPRPQAFTLLDQICVSTSGYLAPSSFPECLQLLHFLVLLILPLLSSPLPGLGHLSQHLWKTRTFDPRISLLDLINIFFFKP